MSFAEYVKGLDQSQLSTLIELAQARVAEIKASGWVKLWQVSDGVVVHGWFVESDHATAVKLATAKLQSQKMKDRNLEVRVELVRVRPEEVEELLADTETTLARKKIVRD